MALTILSIAPISSNKASGLHYSVPQMTAALWRAGAEIALLTTSRKGPYEEAQPYPVFHYGSVNRSAGIGALPAPYNRPQLLVFHSTYIPAQAALAKQARANGIPYVITPRGGMTRLAQRKKRVKKALGNLLFFRRMVNGAAAIHCLTEREAADVRAWGRPVFVVGNGVDLPDIGRTMNSRADDRLRCVFIGRLDIDIKGLDLLVQGCALVQHGLRVNNMTLHLYGPDSSGDGERLRKLVQRYGLGDVIAIEGPVFGDEKDRVLREADLFVHTSRFEGHPMAVLEALSYGVPCMLTPGTSMSAEVAAGGAGWEVDDTPEGIAAGFRQIFSTPATRLAEMRCAARQLAESRYSWGVVAEQLLCRYRQILRG